MAHEPPAADRPSPPDATLVPGPVAAASNDATLGAPLASNSDTALSLSSFANYELLGELSRGGVGIIYRARQKGLGRVVALKVLQSGAMASLEQVQRFLNEAQAAAKLQHPNIVPIHDFGSHDGQHFFTMDFIEGNSLADLMEKGPIPAREALEIVRQTAQALHYAHERGVIHRDIKPGNILLDQDGRVKITDFGIAKEIDRSNLSLTMEGQVMGTPRYMSPEQASGKTAQADRRSDVFSLGTTFYEMLTGKAAFDAENVYGVLQKVVTLEPLPPHKLNGKVHRDVATICLKAMEKRPERRYQTAAEMAEDIQRFLDGEPIQARPVGPVEHLLRRGRRHWRVLTINAAVLALAAGGVRFYLQSRPALVRALLTPTAANVSLNGQPIPPESVTKGLQLLAGRHTLLVERDPEFRPLELALDLKPGEQRSLDISLSRRQGRVLLTTDPPDAAITLVGPNNFHAPFRGPRVERVLPTGPYAVLVHRENHLAQRAEFVVADSQTNQLHFLLPPTTLWSVLTSAAVMSVPAVADMDGDGVGEIVAGDDAGKVYCLSGRNGVALWVYSARDAVQTPVALADLNRDGVLDVLVGSADGSLSALHGRNGGLLWSHPTKGPVVGPTLLRDLTGDGVADAVFGSGDGSVRAVGGTDGKLLWSFATRGRIESCLGWAGNLLLVGSADQSLYVLEPRSGARQWELPIGVPLLFPPRLDNGQVLLPTPQAAGDIRTMTAVSLEQRQASPPSDRLPVRLDLDGDGQAERIVVTDKGTSVFAADGVRLLWSCDYQAIGFYAADVDGDQTYDLIFHNGPDEVLCLSGSTGAVLGRLKLEVATGRGFALEDVDRDGVPDVVLGAGNKLYCFSWVGGRQQWSERAESYYDVPAVSAAGLVLTKTQAGEICARDPSRSVPLWKHRTAPQPSPYTGLAAADGVVVDADAQQRKLRAWRAQDGQPLWEKHLVGAPNAPIGWPAVGQSLVIAGDGHESVTCREATNGLERWSAALPNVTVAPAIGRETVWVADGGRSLHALRLSDGQIRWRFAAPTADPFPAPPALVDVNQDGIEDAVALNDNGFVYALDGRDGQVLWQLEHSTMRARSRNRLVLVPETQAGVLGNAQGDVLWLDLRQGRVLWRSPLKTPILGEPAVADLNSDGQPDVVVGTTGRRLYCLDGKDGQQLWSWESGAPIRYSAPLLLQTAPAAVPMLFVGTGPPANALYALRGNAPRRRPSLWLSPWRPSGINHPAETAPPP